MSALCLMACSDQNDNPRLARWPSLLCGPCYANLRRTVVQSVGIYVHLGRTMIRLSVGWNQPLSGTRIPPAPLREDLHDLRVDLAGKLACWARLIAEERTLRGPYLHRVSLRNGDIAPDDLHDLVVFVRDHLSWASEQLWVDALVVEMRDTMRRIHAACPWRVERRDLPAPCPGCGMQSLALYTGDDHVICRTPDCGEVIKESLYEHYVRVLCDEQVTAA